MATSRFSMLHCRNARNVSISTTPIVLMIMMIVTAMAIIDNDNNSDDNNDYYDGDGYETIMSNNN